jgi:2-phospho-L-lactate guanylyltransferase (CobY/MobA/RfbA family)
VDDVTNLARELATGVLRACDPRPVYVVTESDDVERFANDLGAKVLRPTSSTLNDAVTFAYHSLAGQYERVMIVHGDLKDPAGLGAYEPSAGVTIFTDHFGAGTNVLVVPTGYDFHFSYGPSSKSNHVREADRLGLTVRVIEQSPWRFDVDEPSDLD